jgi:hypothetical protein
VDGGYSTVLLGDPGAGKTTTLKRIALSLLLKAPQTDSDQFQFPLVILLKDLPRQISLNEEIANVFGLSPDPRIAGENLISQEPSPSTSQKIGGLPIEEALADVLNSTSALVLIDGLDEIEISRRPAIEREIEALGLRLTRSKIAVSCRSGDYVTTFHGFRVFEILPLDRAEIQQISRAWLTNADEFLRQLEKAPYFDLVDRPLLLSFLIYLFSGDRELPEQPSLIYRKVVYRLLRDWDEERRIKRVSRYAHFDPDRKIDFLSELSYFLTYVIKGKSFSETEFEEAYRAICTSFSLPESECRQVATEIETHTGVIVSSGLGTFDFSHLSVQEYLCANYICRSPLPDLLRKYLVEYPAPVAVACALSSNASLFFAEMINRHLSEKFRDPHDGLHGEAEVRQLTFDLFGINTSPALKSFLSRLRVENPMFKVEIALGESTLCLFAFYYRRYSPEIDEALTGLLGMRNVTESVNLAFASQGVEELRSLTDETVVFSRDSWFRSVYERVAGPWPSEEARQNLLPLVLFPKNRMPADFAKDLKPARGNRNLWSRITKTLGPSPLCAIEFGQHRLSGGYCTICGFWPSRRSRFRA